MYVYRYTHTHIHVFSSYFQERQALEDDLSPWEMSQDGEMKLSMEAFTGKIWQNYGKIWTISGKIMENMGNMGKVYETH